MVPFQCLGTLEEVHKSGLFVHKQEESNKQVKAKSIHTPQLQKTAGNVTESNAEGQPNYQEAVSKQKGIRRGGSYSAMDLSKRPKLLPFHSLTIGNPFMSQNNSQSSISVSHIENLTQPTTVKGKPTSILQEKPSSELNINAPEASKKGGVSDHKNNSSKKSVELPHQENKSLFTWNNKRAMNTGSSNSENSESLKNEISKKCEVEKFIKNDQKKKIRSKLRSKIKESYHSTKTKASKGYERDENSNFKGKRSFRPPFYPVYGMRC